MKRTGVIVLSRLDSKRLPGKALRMINGKPMVHYVLERAERIKGVDLVVFATSDREVDDALSSYVKKLGFPVFRGSADDVAGRVLACAQHFDFSTIVRVCGDSPLIDYELLSKGLAIFKSNKYDIVTNRYPRSFPAGMSMEILSMEAFSMGYQKMGSPEHFEHVTIYFYERPDAYLIHNVESGNSEYAEISLAIDTIDDIKRFEWMLEAMGPSYLDLNGLKVIEFYKQYQQYQGKKENIK